MKLLLDTHALIWFISGDNRLGVQAKEAFLNQDNKLYFSKASLWEMTIKISLGKLILVEHWLTAIENEMVSNGIQWLEIEIDHCKTLADIPFHHRDPFDRLLISQAITESMSIVSIDDQFSHYPLEIIW
jgi:PIN domain nuclease of toxin-antitoxin system